MQLTPQDRERYGRQLMLAEFGPQAQARLKASRVLVVGAGGLGCPALLYLAASGVGRIVVVDPDRVSVSNLQRQVLFSTAEVGEPKVEAAARRLRALNDCIAIEPRAERFCRANALALVGDCDVVVDGSDNFATRYLVNDACVLAGKPFVYGAIRGFGGQLSVFNWQGGPTYRCLFPQPPEAGTAPNCAEAGVLGVLPGLVGTAQAAEAIKVLTGVGEPLSGRLLLWDVLTMSIQIVALAADPHCRNIRELPAEAGPVGCAAPELLMEEISAAALRALLGAPEPPLLLDVREAAERARGTLQPSVHLPLGALESGGAAALLAGVDRAAPTVVFCARGARSQRAVRLLQERHGFTDVRHLHGGMEEWPAPL